MVYFTKFHIAGLEINEYKKLIELFKKQLDILGIACNANILTDGFVLNEVEKGKVFKSKDVNIIPMKTGDPRIEKSKRDYLESHRLTKDQYSSLVIIINSYFMKMGITCLIEFQEFADDVGSKYILVENKKVVGNLPVPGSFPIKKGA